jgi:hypothetical protein
MTLDPHHRFAIIPVFPSTNTEEAICIGPMSEVMQYLPQTTARADALKELERARVSADEIKAIQDKTRGVQAAILADSVAQLTRRMDALVARREEQARRDAEEAEREEAERIQAHLDAQPDPDDPDVWTPSGAEFPTPELEKPPVVSQPISVSLNKE